MASFNPHWPKESLFKVMPVIVGIKGSHYHDFDCKMASVESFMGHSELYDYVVVEVPVQIILGDHYSFMYIDRMYHSCPSCYKTLKTKAESII